MAHATGASSALTAAGTARELCDTPTGYPQVLGEDHPDTLTSANNLAADPSALDELGHVDDLIVRRLLRGKVVPVLGAGVNLSERPPHVTWELGRYLPSGQELAAELAKHLGNTPIDSYDLARVSQYLAALQGEGSLYDELHDVFDADYPPTLVS